MSRVDPDMFSEASLCLQKIMGKVSASFSHEVKNQLTVINEQAGLLHDLSKRAAAVGGLDPDRVENLSVRISDRVRQANDIVKNYNTFSHLSDKPLDSLEAGGILGLMVQMHRRLADMKPVALKVDKAAQVVELTTRPLFLAAALFACLEAAVNAAPTGGEIKTWVVGLEDEIRFWFSWEEGKKTIADGPGRALLALLGASLHEPPQGHELVLAAPRLAP